MTKDDLIVALAFTLLLIVVCLVTFWFTLQALP